MVARTGRDNLPTGHIAVRHDLTHPSMPAAAVAALKHRHRSTLGITLTQRVRVLPPLDPRLLQALVKSSVAVLDPFPVGSAIPIMLALRDGVPVVSAPGLQECTNSYTESIAWSMGLPIAKLASSTHSEEQDGHVSDESEEGVVFRWPSSAEEYSVLALRLQENRALREAFTMQNRQKLAGSRRELEEEAPEHFTLLSTTTEEEVAEYTSTSDALSQGDQFISFVRQISSKFWFKLEHAKEEREDD